MFIQVWSLYRIMTIIGLAIGLVSAVAPVLPWRHRDPWTGDEDE